MINANFKTTSNFVKREKYNMKKRERERKKTHTFCIPKKYLQN